MSKIFIPCQEANHVCDKAQYKEATFFERVKLNIHLLYCRACRSYTKNNRKLSSVLDSNAEASSVSPLAKEKLKSDFEKELANYNKKN